ncbi:lipase family protein [Sorangium sp. So ce1153]|uniref:lipase family protein n=1 Tax=Sorangium sp. So ce1153 TaxID=3133333 RepID=UPI003F5EB5E9
MSKKGRRRVKAEHGDFQDPTVPVKGQHPQVGTTTPPFPEVTASAEFAQLLGPTDESEHLARATYILAQLSAWAYAERADFDRVLVQILGNAVRSHSFSLTNDALLVNAHAYLVVIDVTVEEGKPPKHIGILVFRGTSWGSALDWVIDASVETTQFGDYGHVHSGFMRNVWRLGSTIRETLRNELLKTKSPIDVLYVTGHSLGGAIAALTTVMLWADRGDEELRRAFQGKFRGLYTFGAPAVGDATMVNALSPKLVARTYMHVYENDIVPRMPPLSTGNFQHFGTTYHSTAEGWVRGETVRQAYTGILANLLGVFPFALRLFTATRWVNPALSFVTEYIPFTRWFVLSWADHSPINYLRCSQISTLPPAG